MNFLEKYGEPFGVETLTLLSFYGTLSIIVLGALIIGIVVQVWKGRSGSLWAIASLVLAIGAWLYAFNAMDSALYAVSWGGDQGWGVLALEVSGIVLTTLLLVAAVLPADKPTIKKARSRQPLQEPLSSFSAEPVTPVLPRQVSHSFRRKLFTPMVVLGVVAFIALGIMSVEKEQFDIFLRSIGIIKAEAPTDAKTKSAKPSAAKKKTEPKAPLADPLIAKAQNLLLGLGYNAGEADGTAGGKTEDAVRAYQKWEGLPRDGKITRELVTHLKKVKKIREEFEKEPPIIADYQPHANMCVRGTRAWYRSRTTKLNIDNLGYSEDKYSIETQVWFSYPGEKLERVRAKAACKYSRYREEMPEAPFSVIITTGKREEILSALELGCFSRGQPC